MVWVWAYPFEYLKIKELLMTQKERDTQGFFQHAETNIYEIPYVYLASPFFTS